jgi:hypothetical protein
MASARPEKCGKIIVVAKRKKKRFDVTKAVKAAAREQIGAPPVARIVPDKKKRPAERHKATLGKLLREDA